MNIIQMKICINIAYQQEFTQTTGQHINIMILNFKECGYYLHRVNHTYWFGKGSFHTKKIEGI